MERQRYTLLAAALFGSYFAAARLGIELSVAHGVITPVWAPTGIALVALVLFGPRLWPAVALGALAANATSGASLPEAAFISVGNTLEAVVGATLLLSVGFRPALDRVRDVFALLGLAAIASTTISATNGVTTLWISGDVDGSDYASEWLLWWIGDAMGDLIVAPLLFVIAGRPWRELHGRRRLEGLLVVALLVAVSSIVFLAGAWRYPHVLFPLLIWATLRFHQLGAAAASFVVAAIAVGGAVEGTIPLGDGSATHIVQVLEGLTAVVAVSLLLLGAVLAERSAAVRDLEAAHSGLAEAQELAHVGSWEWDVPGNRLTWSEELYRLWGIDERPEEMTYEWYLASVHPDDRDLVRGMVERSFATGTPFEFDHRISLPKGRSRWIHSRGRVVSDAHGAPLRMLGTAQDITERKQIDELRDSILSTVSHELRTPLTAIVGFSLTLKKRGAQLADETRAEIVAHLTEQAQKLERLLSDLLDIDRLRRGSVRPTFRETDVMRLVEKVVVGHSAPSHRIDLKPGRAIAEVDAPKVERIVDNLLANAVNHTPAGTEITVRVAEVEHGVQIAVEDNGPGVVDTEREAIFEIFSRGGGATYVPGTGVGLSLVAQFTAVHGGRAWVEERPGGGASFRVFLPARSPG